MTSQAPVEKTRSVPDGDALPHPRTESPDAITDGPDRLGPADPPTVALTLGVDDAAVHGVDEVLGREVRLVTLPPASGDELSERIEQVRHLARLHHPHLLEVYDVDGLAPDTESTLVLENVAGEPLAVVLREGPIAEPAVARMGAQLASALAHAHAHGVEHGAIGAASILVDRTHTDAWLVGLTASLSGPLPVIDPDADDDGAARRRASDVRALAAVLGELLEHTIAATGGDDPAAVTLPTAREDDVPASPLAALLREVDSPEPPSAAAFSDQLARIGRGVAAHEAAEEPARLVPVVASWSESPATGIPVPPELLVPAALAAGPSARARGAGGVTPLTVIGPTGRRARRAGVLGAATATLALASGLVIWAGESHPVRPEAQAEIGASAPSSIVPPSLVPRLDEAGSPPGGGGGGGTWTGGSSGSEQVAVGVASRKAALREEPSPAAVESSESSALRSAPIPEPSDPVVPPSTTRPRTSTPPRTTTAPPTTTTRPTTTRTTPTSTVAPTTTTAAPTTTTAAPTTTTAAPTTTTAKATSSTVARTTVAPATTSSEQVLAAGQ
ncbi:MAG: eukaryotic-like serine/threonine-protein kinase [Actinomycetota bacterium]|nr:eukaryotic-like serine/threonine-protein kinase [Actinomycetota bacterium]